MPLMDQQWFTIRSGVETSASTRQAVRHN